MKKKNIFVILIVVIFILAIILTNVISKKNNNISNNIKVEDNFCINLNDIDISPGKEFDEKNIPEQAAVSEIPSCAFEGTDKVYTYENIEITVSEINGKNIIYSVYFINDNIKTSEGIKITDGKEKMIEIYGQNYENSITNKYIYTKNNVKLSFLIENDIITGIEYTLNLE